MINSKITFDVVHELPEPMSKEEVAKHAPGIEKAMEKVQEEMAPYRATEEQLEEHPWLKNAVNGLTTVEQLIYEYENNINDGSLTHSSTQLGSDLYSNSTGTHELTANLNSRLQYLSWDDENYTRSGTTTYSMDFKDVYFKANSTDVKTADISINLDTTPLTEETISNNYENFINELNNNDDFKDDFYKKVESYLNNNDSESLKDFLTKILMANTEESSNEINSKEKENNINYSYTPYV